jgi:hypothetical protein
VACTPLAMDARASVVWNLRDRSVRMMVTTVIMYTCVSRCMRRRAGRGACTCRRTDLNEDARVESLREVSLGLTEELAGEKDVGCGAITGDVLLCSGGTGDDGGGRVLNLLRIWKERVTYSAWDVSVHSDGGIERRQRARMHSNAASVPTLTISSRSTLPSLVILI